MRMMRFFLVFTADTEGSFIVERVVDIADAAVKHMQHVVQSSNMDEIGTFFFKLI